MSHDVAQAFAPGRVNLIGEHTDYCEGLALPFAVGAGVTVTATALPGDRIEVLAADLQEQDSFSAESPERTTGWRAFARGVVALLTQAGATMPGARIEVSSDLPSGAGLSSSAALTLALYLALAELARAAPLEPVAIARICQTVENQWVGAQTGLLDQLASLCGTEGHATLIDFRELSIQPVPLNLGDHRLVVLNSGDPHTNAASGYNRRREECAEAAHRVGAESLRDALFQDLHMLPDVLARRARHVIGENGRVLEAADALDRGDMQALGTLLDASHTSLRDNFEVSTPELEQAVATLKQAGALGARLMGAGFGGSVLGLMPTGTDLPKGVVEVSACAGARLLPQTALP